MTEKTLYVITLIALAFVTVQVHRIPRNSLTLPLYGYVASQFMFVFLCLLARLENWSDRNYERIFYFWQPVVALSMLYLLWTFGRSLAVSHLLASAGISFLLGCWAASLLREALYARDMTNPFWSRYVASACFFVACGIVGLLTLTAPAGSLADVVKVILSLLWIGTGVDWLFNVGLYLRDREDIVTRTQFLPSLAAVLLFFLLGLSLVHHAEAGIQGTAERVSAERGIQQVEATQEIQIVQVKN